MAGEELLLLGTETVFSAVGAGAQRVGFPRLLAPAFDFWLRRDEGPGRTGAESQTLHEVLA